MKNRILKKIIWSVIALVLIYAAIIVYTDASQNIETLRAFPWKSLPLIVGAVLVNFLVRWIKWEWFRRAAGVDVPLSGSFLIFFSGFSMAISPGRVGELIKPFMYKEYFNKKMRRTIPLVFCERISDLLGMVILTVLTAAAFGQGVAASGVRVFQVQAGQTKWSVAFIQGFLIATVAMMAIAILAARRKRLVYWFLFGLSSRPKLAGPAGKLRKLYFATYPLLTVRNLVVTSLLGAFSWSFECFALWKVLEGFGADQVNLLQATFVFCMATIFGGFLFFMPGGIGGFEGGMLAMLSMLGVPQGQIYPSTIVIRFCTLIFSVVLGFLFILLTSIRYHKGLEWEEFQMVSEKAEAAE